MAKTYPINEFETSEKNVDAPRKKAKFTFYLLFCILASVYGGTFQFGWNVSVFNIPVMEMYDFYNQTFLKRYGTPISENTKNLLWSITNGIVPLGGILGGFLSGYIADFFGRKKGMLVTNVFVVLSGILCIISKFIPSHETLIVGRFFSGVLSGIFTGICALYVAEISPTDLRGFASTMSPLALTSGILFANIIGLPEILGTDKLWPILVGFMFIPMLISLCLIFAVESPKYIFINKRQPEEAKKILEKLRKSNYLVEEELKELEVEKKLSESQSNSKFIDFIKVKPLRKAIIVTLFTQIAQQLIGADAMIFYSTEIFINAGLGSSWSNYGTIILGALQVIMTIICMFTIEIAGRRVLLITGTVGVSFSCFSLAIFRIFAADVPWFKYMTIVSAVSFTIFFNIGPGSVAFMIATELFDSNMRGKATSLAVLLNWTCIFIITVSYPFIEEKINNYSFLIFGVDSLIFVIILYLILPETRNKTIEEIKEHFEKMPICYKLKSKSKNERTTTTSKSYNNEGELKHVELYNF